MHSQRRDDVFFAARSIGATPIHKYQPSANTMFAGIQHFKANLASVEIACLDGNSISTKRRKKDIIPKRVAWISPRPPR